MVLALVQALVLVYDVWEISSALVNLCGDVIKLIRLNLRNLNWIHIHVEISLPYNVKKQFVQISTVIDMLPLNIKFQVNLQP